MTTMKDRLVGNTFVLSGDIHAVVDSIALARLRGGAAGTYGEVWVASLAEWLAHNKMMMDNGTVAVSSPIAVDLWASFGPGKVRFHESER